VPAIPANTVTYVDGVVATRPVSAPAYAERCAEGVVRTAPSAHL